MNLSKACSNILLQLSAVIEQIKPEDFSRPSDALGGSSIGQHIRHTLEFFFCFQQGYENGSVNYDKRAHDKLIETDKYAALNSISTIGNFIQTLNANKTLTLEVGYHPQQEDYISITTNTSRELVYNIEHAVHHMAIMKIGIREVAPYIQLPDNFGIAASTIRFQESVHQSSH